jgi:hypothetical protein
MRKPFGALLLATATAALTIGLGATSSLAATAQPTWSVSPGGAVTLTKSGVVTLQDTTTGNSLTCTKSKGTASFAAGTGLSGTDIAAITAVSFATCTGPMRLNLKMTAGNLPWELTGTSYNPAITSGLTIGTLSGIHATLSGAHCSATVDGSSATGNDGETEFHYHNSLRKLKTESALSNLHVYNVTGCAGVLNSGDAVALIAAWLVSPAQTITQS